jgi:hypothetical protein
MTAAPLHSDPDTGRPGPALGRLPQRMAAIAGAAAVAVTLWCRPAPAQMPDPAPLFGLWMGDAASGVEIEAERLWRIDDGTRLEISQTQCTSSFEQLPRRRSRSDILGTYLAGRFEDDAGKPLGDRLQAALPDGSFLTLTSACCCIDDVNRGMELIALNDAEMVAVSWQEGVFDLQRLVRQAPPQRTGTPETAAATPAGPEGPILLGTWWRCPGIGVEIEAERLWHLYADERREYSPAICLDQWGGFSAEFTFRERLSDAILATWLGSVDDDGQPIDAALHAGIFTGTYQTLETSCESEITGGTWYILGQDDRLMAIDWGDGLARLTWMTREPPAPSNDCLYAHERRGVQSGLRSLGFYNGGIDGILGPQSLAAIAAYQTSIGEEPTGIVTAEQVRELSGIP